MILSESKNVYKIYIVTKRDVVTEFFRKVVKVSNNILSETFLPELNLSPNILVVIDSYILESSSLSFFDEIKSKEYPILCLETPFLSERVKGFVEKNFRYVIPFPVQSDLFIKFFLGQVEKIQQDYSDFKLLKEKMELNEFFVKNPGDCRGEPRLSVLSCGEEVKDKSLFGFFLGESKVMYNLRKKIRKIAEADVPVLLLGETGTGKSTCAGIIHRLSKRSKYEMKSLNISTIDEAVACSTFFGTTLGAFTDALDKKGLFTLADKGTLFLDEIGIASTAVQSMLLTVVETGMFRKVGSETFEKSNVRLLFATNADLGEMVKNGSFRKDFFCRICGNVINFPTLRSRKEDIPYIINNYIKRKGKIFSDNAFNKLIEYNWPGNIRELHQCIDRALLYSSKDIIEADDIDFGLFCL